MLRKFIISFAFLGNSIFAFGQKQVFLTNQIKKVPQGKKWILLAKKEIKIEFSLGTLTSGTFCNAMLESNPNMSGTILVGEYGNPTEAYGVILMDIEKAPQTSEQTYNVTPIVFTDSKFRVDDLRSGSVESAGRQQIVFNSGEEIYLSQCLLSLPVVEVDNNSNYGQSNPIVTQGKSPRYVYRGKYYSNSDSNKTAKTTNWDISHLLEIKTLSQLSNKYGAANIIKEQYAGIDDDLRNGTEYVLYPNSLNEIRINFEKRYVKLTKKHSQWILNSNLYVGCTLNEVEKKNEKEFFIYGFEWDEAGNLASWDNGKLENSNIALLKFIPTVELQHNEYSKVIGANKLKSSNPIIKKLRLEISEIIISQK